MKAVLRPQDSARHRRLLPVGSSVLPSRHTAPGDQLACDEGIRDSEFAACQDLLLQDDPGPEWELLSDKPSGKVWTKKDAGSCTPVYRAHATMSESLPQLVEALTDVSRRKEWDEYCTEITEMQRISDTSVIYWRVKFPFPLSDRDYVYYRRTKTLPNGDVLVLSRSAPNNAHKQQVPGVIRVDDFRTRCALRPTPSGGVEYRMEYREEQAGSVPGWAVKWAMDKAVDAMLDGMRQHMSLLRQ